MPVAVNCCVSPLVMLGLTGVTAIETSAAGLTVSVAVVSAAGRVAAKLALPVYSAATV